MNGNEEQPKRFSVVTFTYNSKSDISLTITKSSKLRDNQNTEKPINQKIR